MSPIWFLLRCWILNERSGNKWSGSGISVIWTWSNWSEPNWIRDSIYVFIRLSFAKLYNIKNMGYVHLTFDNISYSPAIEATAFFFCGLPVCEVWFIWNGQKQHHISQMLHTDQVWSKKSLETKPKRHQTIAGPSRGHWTSTSTCFNTNAENMRLERGSWKMQYKIA